MVRFALIVVVGLALAMVGTASAHEGNRAQPQIVAGLAENAGLGRTLTVRLRDRDSAKPVQGAQVRAFAERTAPAAMRMPTVRLQEVRAGVYRSRIVFAHSGMWAVRIAVTGPNVVAARASLPVQIRADAIGHPSSHGHGEITTLATSFDDSLTRSDYSRMAVLWIHSLAATGWILGVLVLVFGLSTRPGVLAEGARTRLADAYRSWGAWVHWGLVPVIVLTGIYNVIYVAPFALAWSPDEWRALGDVPYGHLYEGILLAKLALFAVLLVSGTLTLARTLRIELPAVPVTNPHPSFLRITGSALGPAGIVYLATVPLILAAAMALRYVHVLSHVPESVAFA